MMSRRELTHGLGLVAALQRARVALIDHGGLISLGGTGVGGGEPVGLGEGSGEGGKNEDDGSKGAGEHLRMKVFERESLRKDWVVELGTCSTEESTSKLGALLY
jgi:hypothetical protein